MNRYIAGAAFMFFYQAFVFAETGSIEVLINGFRNSNGKAVLCLFSKAKGFPEKYNLAEMFLFAKIKEDKSKVILKDIAYGSYAVSLFHDENDNNKLDTNFWGVPKEGVGVSNNAKGSFGPPKYQDALFEFNSKNKVIEIKIEYIK